MNEFPFSTGDDKDVPFHLHFRGNIREHTWKIWKFTKKRLPKNESYCSTSVENSESLIWEFIEKRHFSVFAFKWLQIWNDQNDCILLIAGAGNRENWSNFKIHYRKWKKKKIFSSLVESGNSGSKAYMISLLHLVRSHPKNYWNISYASHY